MTTYSRFKALPRARKGSTTVVIVEEDVLLELLRDVEARGMAQPPIEGPANQHPLTTFTGGATGGAPMQIHVDPPAPIPEVLAEDIRLGRRPRQRPGRIW